MPLKSMKELSQPLTLTIPEESPIYKALMESTKQKNDDEHKVACLEADLEETTDILNAEIVKLKEENETLKEEKQTLKQTVSDRNISLSILREDIGKLKEINKKYKKLDKDHNEMESMLKEEIKKLKEELKKRANVFMAYSADEL